MVGITNHPLVGQRVRLTGTAWSRLYQGEPRRIDYVDEDGDAVFHVNGYVAFANLNDGGDDYAGELVRTIYGSRPRNVDPLPWADGHLDSAGNPRRFAEPYHVDGDGTDCQWCVTRYAPRPEYDAQPPIHPVNPILAWFRKATDGYGAQELTHAVRWTHEHWNETVDSAVRYRQLTEPLTPEHTAHARRVIARLAAL